MNTVVSLRSDRTRTRGNDVSIVNELAYRASVSLRADVHTCHLFFEVYTSLAYSGPPLVKKLNRELATILK